MKAKLCKKFSPLLALAAIIASGVCGCNSVPTVMPADARAQMNQTVVRSYIPQKEVNFEFVPSGYGAGLGLIGAIVDVGVNSALAGGAEGRAKKLRAEVEDFDFRSKYWPAVSNAVSGQKWLKPTEFKALGTSVPPVKAVMVANGSAMNIGSSYSVSPDCRVVKVHTGIDVYAPGKKKAVASVILSYFSSRIGNEEGDKALALWTAENGEAFRRKANEGIEESAKMMRHALESMGGGSLATSARPAKLRAKLVHGRGSFGIPVGKSGLRGMVLEETPERLIFQVERGGLFSFPNDEVEVEAITEK